MKTSELIELLVTGPPLTEAAFVNLMTADLFDCNTEAEVAAAQKLAGYFSYKLRAVVFPAICELRERE